MPSIRPMSWYAGSHERPRLDASFLSAAWIMARLASRLACVTFTPLGRAVEPEVYCRKAMPSPARARNTSTRVRSGRIQFAMPAAEHCMHSVAIHRDLVDAPRGRVDRRQEVHVHHARACAEPLARVDGARDGDEERDDRRP